MHPRNCIYAVTNDSGVAFGDTKQCASEKSIALANAPCTPGRPMQAAVEPVDAQPNAPEARCNAAGARVPYVLVLALMAGGGELLVPLDAVLLLHQADHVGVGACWGRGEGGRGLRLFR